MVTNTPTYTSRRRALVATAALLAGGGNAFGVVWNGGSLSSDNFSDGANWVGGVAPTLGALLEFDGSTRLTPFNDFGVAGSDSTLNFLAGAGEFVIGGTAIRGGAVTNSSSSLQTIGVSLRLNGTRTLNTGDAGVRLTVAPLSTGGGRTYNKTGNGDLYLSYAGTASNIGYSINAGRAIVDNASGVFNQASGMTLAANTTLELAQAETATANFAGGITGAGSVLKTSGGSNNTLSGTLNYTGGTAVELGTLNFASAFTMSGANRLNLDGVALPVAGVDHGQMVASDAVLTFGGTLQLLFTGLPQVGASYNLFGTAGTGSFTGNFAGVEVTGAVLASLTDAGGVWTGSGSGVGFSFDTTTGVLDIIPEPSAFAVLAGLASLGFAAARRRRS